jgi:hypothetical protein
VIATERDMVETAGVEVAEMGISRGSSSEEREKVVYERPCLLMS